MNIKKIVILTAILISNLTVSGQQDKTKFSVAIAVNKELQASFKTNGRLLVYFAETDTPEPRYSSVFSGGAVIFGLNITNWDKNETKHFDASDAWTKTAEWDFNRIPKKDYYIQAVWVQNRDKESQSNSPGNLYSKPIKMDSKNGKELEITLSEVIPERALNEHHLVKLFTMKSDVVSRWWNKPMDIKASVLLPSGYEINPGKKYPVIYNVAGYGGRYTRINELAEDKEFMTWWTSKDAPQIITVFLDGEGPFGDCYQLNSENSGPYGEALINELIPKIEQEFRIIGTPEYRFVEGCSTGGWVSLALQLFYPETFNGCWSYSADPVSFEKMQLINIYKNVNAFYNTHDYLRPSMKDLNGDPMFSIKQEIVDENVQGLSNTYTTSGGQWGAWNALYSPKGTDGLPKPIFDPNTGVIDKEVAEHWKKYDLLLYTSANWATLGPKIKGKIHIWMGDRDNFYLNNAMRDFDNYLKNTLNPKSDAQIEFSPMMGHCSIYSNQRVLKEIEIKIKEIERK